MAIGMAGTSPAMTTVLWSATCRHHFRFNFQTATSIHALPFTHAHSFSRLHRASCGFGFAPTRGAWSAVRRTLSSFRFRHRVRSDDVSESASPHGAPQTSLRSLRKLDCYLAAICEPGTVLPGEDGGATRPLIRQAFACLRPSPRPAANGRAT